MFDPKIDLELAVFKPTDTREKWAPIALLDLNDDKDRDVTSGEKNGVPRESF